MESLNLPTIILIEGLFLALVVAVVWMLIGRRRLRDVAQSLEKSQLELAELRSRLKQAQAKQNRPAPAPAGEDKQTQKIKSLQQHNQQSTLATYKRRISNLEQFKELYLELEKQIENANEESEYAAKKVKVLQGIIDTQNQLIEGLKSDLNQLAEQHLDDHETEQLLDTISQLENNSDALRQELNHVKRQRSLAELDNDKLSQYKDRVQTLEKSEKRLKKELESYHEQGETLREQLNAKARHGSVNVREIKDLSNQLAKRDDEIRRLRQECETIALQYEELARRSMEITGAGDNLSDEQKALLEELTQQLEVNSAELSRKRAECEMLENCYMELQQQSAAAEQASIDMENSFREHNELAGEQRKIGAKIASVADTDMAAELEELQQTLTRREETLEKVRADYREIKQQFIEIAQDEAELRESNRALKAECAQLKKDISLLQQNQPDTDASEELTKLQAEYNKLEARYLALLERPTQ